MRLKETDDAFGANGWCVRGKRMMCLKQTAHPFCTGTTLYYLKSYAVLFALGILGSTPVVKNAARRMDGTKAGAVLEAAAMLALLIVCTAYLVDGSFSPFLYFRF